MIHVIDIQDVKKSYRKRGTKETIEAVKGISFQVKKGEIVGLLGPNGAGKTTLIKIMCGLLIPNEGKVMLNGVDVRSKRLRALEHISVVLEGNRNLYWRLTVKENLEYFAGNRGYSKKQIEIKMNELLERFHLTEKQNEMVNSLSRGMQQKVAIAVALLSNTDIIFLDEPTLGLDIETSYEIRKLLKEIAVQEQKTIIISTHDMPVVQDVCERVIIVNHGQVVVDDKVGNLLQLFESKAYLFTLNHPLTVTQINQLESNYVISMSENDSGQTLLEVNIQKGEDLYKILNILEQNNSSIEKIDRTIVDFEEVFMKIVKEGGKRNELVQSV